jgi:hypothetical protein
MNDTVLSFSGLECIGVPIINDGTANFIQLYVGEKNIKRPYIRIGMQSHSIMLDEFLKENNLNKNDYELVGGGIICKAQILRQRGQPQDFVYAISGQCGSFQKYPDMTHINHFKLLFDRDVILYDRTIDYDVHPLIHKRLGYISKNNSDVLELKLTEYTRIGNGFDSDTAFGPDDDSEQ